MKKILISILTVLTLIMSPLTIVTPYHDVYAQTITLNKKSVILKKGKTTQLKVIGANNNVTFQSSNKNVAIVNRSGKVQAKGKGTCIISARINGKTLKCKVTVKQTLKLKITVCVSKTGKRSYSRVGCRRI